MLINLIFLFKFSLDIVKFKVKITIMKFNSFINRHIEKHLPPDSRKRIVILTGARQTGKTTLVKSSYSDLNYLNLDAVEYRDIVSQTSSLAWHRVIGSAVIDEAQKEPAVFEKIKFAYDAGDISFSVLTGSSQILLLKNIRETMAGRAFIFELWPLLQSELHPIAANQAPQTPLLQEIIVQSDLSGVLAQIQPVLFGTGEIDSIEVEQHLLQWGGMPGLLPLSELERWKWLKDYCYLYLERDLGDLAKLDDLRPFRKFQQLAALRSGKLLNYSELARDTGISVDTARRYLEYLKISYQSMTLQPFYRNLTSRVIKSPKLYWLDVGILRQLSGFKEGVTGELYETMVVSEIYKWVKTSQTETDLYFYRTQSGMELDLLLKTDTGYIGMEIKSRETVVKKDWRIMGRIAQELADEWKGGIIVYSGNHVYCLDAGLNIWAVPSRRLFQADPKGRESTTKK